MTPSAAAVPRFWWRVLLIAGLGLVARLAFFTGMALGDDVFYTGQAYLLAFEGGWPPAPYHWHTRAGLLLPTAACLKLFGPAPWVYVLWPLLASTATVGLTAWAARPVAGDRGAVLAALLAAFTPLELIYATHLFPDVVVGLFSAGGLAAWLRALQTDARWYYLLAGTGAGLGYLCRETVVMDVPVYLALWAWTGRWWRPRLLWAALPPAALLAGEMLAYSWATGDPAYRWKAVAGQQQDPGNRALIFQSVYGGNFVTDPLLMLVSSNVLGVYPLAAGVVALAGGWRRPEVRPHLVWLAVGFVWTYYGSTLPHRYTPMQRDARYATAFMLPAVVLVAAALARVRRGWVRRGLVAVLLAFGLAGASLDQGNTILAPHRDFLNSEYATSDAGLVPFEYHGVRWLHGLGAAPGVACVSDLGGQRVIHVEQHLPGTLLRPAAGCRWVVASPARQEGPVRELLAAGWAAERVFPGRPTPGRELVGQLLLQLPGQRERAGRLLRPPGLVVYRRPADPPTATGKRK